jgi:hypothetical protein
MACGAPLRPVLEAPSKGPQFMPTLDPARLEAVRKHHHCNCFEASRPETTFHSEVQDEQADGWKEMLHLVEEAAADGREEFAPLRDMSIEAGAQLITLPATIAKLKAVRRLVLYGSTLVRLPPEIGEMESLEEFFPYTSARLHWFPYELTRCSWLRESCVSTRHLYGNYKNRAPFPQLGPPMSSTRGLDTQHLPPQQFGAAAISSCSVCRASIATTELHQVWISLGVATDVLPLLVNACSRQCIAKLPPPAQNYVQGPHRGGSSVRQPPRLCG